MMVRLPTTTAASAAAVLWALSVHVLPALGSAFPSPQTSSTACVSECIGLYSTFTNCNISLDATTYTAAQETCMCNDSSFKSTADQCLTCLLGPSTPYTYQNLCSASLSSSPPSASASRSATRSASASATRTASGTAQSSTAPATRTASGAAQSSTASCSLSDACKGFVQTLSGCNIDPANVQDSMTDAQMSCLCRDPAAFEANTANCLACSGENANGVDTMCDSYASSSGLASGTASRSTVRATSTGIDSSGATNTAAIAANPTTTSTGTRSTSTPTSGSTGITGNVLAPNGGSRAVALGMPELVVPVLVMAVAAWRVVF